MQCLRLHDTQDEWFSCSWQICGLVLVEAASWRAGTAEQVVAIKLCTQRAQVVCAGTMMCVPKRVCPEPQIHPITIES